MQFDSVLQCLKCQGIVVMITAIRWCNYTKDAIKTLIFLRSTAPSASETCYNLQLFGMSDRWKRSRQTSAHVLKYCGEK